LSRASKASSAAKAAHRAINQIGGVYTLREQREAYDGDVGSEIEALRLENTSLWDEKMPETAET
jgi:hypothetical protein